MVTLVEGTQQEEFPLLVHQKWTQIRNASVFVEVAGAWKEHVLELPDGGQGARGQLRREHHSLTVGLVIFQGLLSGTLLWLNISQDNLSPVVTRWLEHLLGGSISLPLRFISLDEVAWASRPEDAACECGGHRVAKTFERRVDPTSVGGSG